MWAGDSFASLKVCPYETYTTCNSGAGDCRRIFLFHHVAVEWQAGEREFRELAEPARAGGDHRGGWRRIPRQRRAEQYQRLSQEHSVGGERYFQGHVVRLLLRDGAAGGPG